MDMPGDSGAGAFADIHPEVQAVWFIDRLEMTFGSPGQRHHLGRRSLVDSGKLGGVRIRHHHQMTAGVGKPVENYVVMNAAENNEICFVGFRLSRECAENTGNVFSRLDEISIAPGAPKMVQVGGD